MCTWVYMGWVNIATPTRNGTIAAQPKRGHIYGFCQQTWPTQYFINYHRALINKTCPLLRGSTTIHKWCVTIATDIVTLILTEVCVRLDIDNKMLTCAQV